MKHNAASHFCPQAFLLEQSFPILSLSCSSTVILLLFCCSNFTRVTLISFRVTLRDFSVSRSCPSYWLRSSSDQIYQQYYCKYIYIYIYIYIYTYIYIYNIYIYIYLQSFYWHLVLVGRAEVFKYKYLYQPVLSYWTVLPIWTPWTVLPVMEP